MLDRWRLPMLFAALATAGPACGQYLPIQSVEVLPDTPTASDPITLVLSGERGMPNQVIIGSGLQITDDSIHLDINFYDDGGITVPVVTDWRHQEELGRLPEGEYQVTVRTLLFSPWLIPPITADVHPFTLSVLSGFEPGDYNRDGSVDTSDYDVWSRAFGSSTNDWADGNGDGLVDSADYSLWRDAYDASQQAAAAPEPTSALLAAQLAAAMVLTCRAPSTIDW